MATENQPEEQNQSLGVGAVSGAGRAFAIWLPVVGVLFLVALAIANTKEGLDGLGVFVVALFGLPVLLLAAVVGGAIRGAQTRNRPGAQRPHLGRTHARTTSGNGYPAASLGAFAGFVLALPASIFAIYLVDFLDTGNDVLPKILLPVIWAGAAATGAGYVLRRNDHPGARRTALLVAVLSGSVYIVVSLFGEDRGGSSLWSEVHALLVFFSFFLAPVIAGFAARWWVLREPAGRDSPAG